MTVNNFMLCPEVISESRESASLCDDQCWASRLVGGPAWSKTLNIPMFSDTINVTSVKLCMIVLLIKHYLFIPHASRAHLHVVGMLRFMSDIN